MFSDDFLYIIKKKNSVFKGLKTFRNCLCHVTLKFILWSRVLTFIQTSLSLCAWGYFTTEEETGSVIIFFSWSNNVCFIIVKVKSSMFLIKRYDINTTGNGDIVQQRLSLTQTLRYLFIYLSYVGWWILLTAFMVRSGGSYGCSNES